MEITALIDDISNAVHDDSALNAWSTTAFGQNPSIFNLVNERDFPKTDTYYPLINIFPDTKVVGYQVERKQHLTAVKCGIFKEGYETVAGKSRRYKYNGHDLIEEFRKLIETAVVGVFSSPDWVEKITITYDPLEHYPHFYAGMMFEISEDYYQGDGVFV